jgi:hypothetical protein
MSKLTKFDRMVENGCRMATKMSKAHPTTSRLPSQLIEQGSQTESDSINDWQSIFSGGMPAVMNEKLSRRSNRQGVAWANADSYAGK